MSLMLPYPSTKPGARLYGTAQWRRKAQRQLDEAPLCCACKAEGIVKVAEVADHIVPCKDDPVAFWHGELQSLCSRHHDQKRQAERFGKTWQPKLGFDERGWPRAKDHHWNKP